MIERYVAAHKMPWFDLGESRLGAGTQVLYTASGHARATRVQNSSGRRVGRAWDDASKRNAFADGAVDVWHGRQQRLGIRVVRALEDSIGLAKFADAT